MVKKHWFWVFVFKICLSLWQVSPGFADEVVYADISAEIAHHNKWEMRFPYMFTVDDDFSDFETQKIFQKVSRQVEMTRAPNFRRFLRADARGIFPIFFRTIFIGGFVYEPNEIETQAQLIRLSAAIYLWLTLQSIENPVWSEENEKIPKPVLDDMESDAKEFETLRKKEWVSCS